MVMDAVHAGVDTDFKIHQSTEYLEKISTLTFTIPQRLKEFSGHTTSMSFKQVGESTKLIEIIGDPDEALRLMGLVVNPSTIDRVKADTLIHLATIKSVDGSSVSPPDEMLAVLLSSTSSFETDLRSLREVSIRQDNSLGLQSDLELTGEKLGGMGVKLVKEGSLDRLTASCVAKVAEDNSLSITQALELAKSITQNPLPDAGDTLILKRAKQLMIVNTELLSRFPRSGMKPADVPFRQLTNISASALERLEQLRNPTTRIEFMKTMVEGGQVPPSISNLQDVLGIIDKNPNIKAVSFDLYDTLVQWTEDFWDRFGRYPKRAIKFCKQAGMNISEKEFADVSGQVWSDMWNAHQSKGDEVPLTKTLGEVVTRLTKVHAINPDARKLLEMNLAREYYDLELENAVAMPGALETLKGLKDRGVKVCLTSNAAWSQAHVSRVLKRFGLEKYFDAVSLSSDIGKMKKPNVTEFFHHSWDKLGVPRRSILHVGDNPHDDVVGARNAGALSTHYHNKLAYNRLEIAGTRNTSPELYAQTVVSMQEQSTEAATYNWIQSEMERLKIPQNERERVFAMAKEMHRQSRDIIAPMYINYSEKMLQDLNSGKADGVLCLARDGLAISVAMKLMRRLDPDRYPNVKSEQIKYVLASRGLLKKVISPEKPEHFELRDKYLGYLRQKNVLDLKKVILADVVSAGTSYDAMKSILGTAEVKGYFIDAWIPPREVNRRSFLQEATGVPESMLLPETLLLFMESLFNGPNMSIKNFDKYAYNGKDVIRPITTKKKLPENVLQRGISEQGILFINNVATRGIMDAVHIRHRARVANIVDPSDKNVADKFVELMRSNPNNDLRRTIPWQDGEYWFLASQNPTEDPRIKKKGL